MSATETSEQPGSTSSSAARATGAGLVLVSTLAVQGSAAISAALFADLGATAVAGLRQMLGAMALIVLVRPRSRGRPASQWWSIGALGAAMASMNAAYYHAVALVPLGIAATLLYLGPFALAVAHTPRGRQLGLPCLALAGVVLVAGPSVTVDLVGVLVGLLAAAALAWYTLASAHLGRSSGVDALALATSCSALLLSPFTLIAAPAVTSRQWPVLCCAGVLGVSLTFASDFAALRLAGTRIVSVLFALDPVAGALLGAVLLHQMLTPTVVAGIILIVVAGATVSGMRTDGGSTSRRRRRHLKPAASPWLNVTSILLPDAKTVTFVNRWPSLRGCTDEMACTGVTSMSCAACESEVRDRVRVRAGPLVASEPRCLSHL